MKTQLAKCGRPRDPGIKAFVKHVEGVTIEEAIRRAEEKNMVIVSNPRWDRALVETDEWKKPAVIVALPCWTGTAFAYVEPGKTLREAGKRIKRFKKKYSYEYYIVYVDPNSNKHWFFPIPEEYLDKKDILLVMNHPDFDLKCDKDLRIFLPHDGVSIGAVEDFPTQDDTWHRPDEVYCIPHGPLADSSDPYARKLKRQPTLVGLVGRVFRMFEFSARYVYLDNKPSCCAGVGVEY